MVSPEYIGRLLQKQVTWINVATMIGTLSLCSADQVGALILTKEGRVCASGYNGPPANFLHDSRSCINWCQRSQTAREDRHPGYTDCPSIHAEVNALLTSRWEDRQGATMFVSSKPCYNCAKEIANSGIAFVICRITERGNQRSDAGVDFLDSVGIEVKVGAV